jgi:hypothetical protein
VAGAERVPPVSMGRASAVRQAVPLDAPEQGSRRRDARPEARGLGGVLRPPIDVRGLRAVADGRCPARRPEGGDEMPGLRPRAGPEALWALVTRRHSEAAIDARGLRRSFALTVAAAPAKDVRSV